MALTSPQVHVDRRQFGRRKTCLHGWIILEGRPRLACLVRNVSEGGALLEFEVPKIMPYRFGIKIESKGFEALCETRHKSDTWIGVQFVRFDQVQQPIVQWSLDLEDSWAGGRR